MNFLFDNNISFKIANAARELFQDNKRHIMHLTDKFPANTIDEVWINQLIKEGNWALISIDRFQKNSIEKMALNNPRLVSFILKSGWSDIGFYEQAHMLIRWMPTFIKQAEKKLSGVFSVPIKYSPSKLEQISTNVKKK